MCVVSSGDCGACTTTANFSYKLDLCRATWVFQSLTVGEQRFDQALNSQSLLAGFPCYRKSLHHQTHACVFEQTRHALNTNSTQTFSRTSLFCSSLCLCCSSANPKQLWGKKGKLCVTAVLLSLCPLGCGARAPKHCMFLCGDWKTWIWTCARFLTVLSLLLQMVSNNQKTWLLPLSIISHTLILDLPQQTWHHVRHVACFLSFSA